MDAHGSAEIHKEVGKMAQVINFQQYEWFDPLGEQAFVLKEGRQKVDCGYRTLMICAQDGRLTPSGARVRLKVCQIPRGLATTLEEFERFVSAISSPEV
jgi:hypothetical protein